MIDITTRKALNLSVLPGFLCGRCPEGEGVDLTLNNCKDCTVADAVVVVIIGKLFFMYVSKSIRVEKEQKPKFEPNFEITNCIHMVLCKIIYTVYYTHTH